MPDLLLEFRSWRIRYDPDVNKRIYSQIPTGGPERCACENCLRFVEMRDTFYPAELKELLARLGIDYRKEAEVVSYAGPGEPPLGGWYNFAGRIESGEQDLQYLDSEFQLEIATGGVLVQKEFNTLPVVKLEWLWPFKDPRKC